MSKSSIKVNVISKHNVCFHQQLFLEKALGYLKSIKVTKVLYSNADGISVNMVSFLNYFFLC